MVYQSYSFFGLSLVGNSSLVAYDMVPVVPNPTIWLKTRSIGRDAGGALSSLIRTSSGKKCVVPGSLPDAIGIQASVGQTYKDAWTDDCVCYSMERWNGGKGCCYPSLEYHNQPPKIVTSVAFSKKATL